MNKEFLKFGDIEIEKQKFYYFQNPININNVDIVDNLISSSKIPFGQEDILKYHPQVFLEECKFEVKKKKIIRLITDDKNFF